MSMLSRTSTSTSIFTFTKCHIPHWDCYKQAPFKHNSTEMISSAVIIPDQTSTEEREVSPPSASAILKRKFSDSHEYERKRPRVDTNTDSLDYDESPSKDTPTHDAPPRSAPVQSPSRRRSSVLPSGAKSAVEEKKRNQRLFGGLLGTLSGVNSKSDVRHKKRDEIEARQRERLKKETEEQEAEKKRRKDDLLARRRREQDTWEEESLRIRHRNMRSLAAFLNTKTEPHLYYLPWELRPEEEERIRTQKEHVEHQIRRELGDSEALPMLKQEPQQDVSQDNEQSLVKEESRDQILDHAPPDTAVKSEIENDKDPPETAAGQEQNGDRASPNPEQAQNNHDDRPLSAPDDRAKEEDHHGEELVEGQEDDVIY